MSGYIPVLWCVQIWPLLCLFRGLETGEQTTTCTTRKRNFCKEIESQQLTLLLYADFFYEYRFVAYQSFKTYSFNG